METNTRDRKRKPDYDRLSESIQVLLKKHEFKNLDVMRRNAGYPNNSGYVRMMILNHIKGKRQLELL